MIANLGVRSQQWMLQREGHYHGVIDGEWSEACRVALQEFATRPEPGFGPAQLPETGRCFVPYEELPTGYQWCLWQSQRIVVPVGAGSIAELIAAWTAPPKVIAAPPRSKEFRKPLSLKPVVKPVVQVVELEPTLNPE